MISKYLNILVLLLAIGVVLPSCSHTKKSKTKKVKTHVTVKKPDEAPKNMEAMLRTDIVEEAKELLGTTYKYAGKTPATGFDCSGFTCYVLKKHGIEVSPGSKYQAKEGKSIPLDKVKPGDLIFFSKDGPGGEVTHVAMVTEVKDDGIYVIHSTTSKGVIINNITTSAYWRPKILYARNVISK